MGNVCGGTKALNDPPTHYRLGSISENPNPPAANKVQAPASAAQSPRPSGHKKGANSDQDREQRAQAAEARAKAAAARGTHASNPKQGQLAAQVNKRPPPPTQKDDEEPLRWD